MTLAGTFVYFSRIAAISGSFVPLFMEQLGCFEISAHPALRHGPAVLDELPGIDDDADLHRSQAFHLVGGAKPHGHAALCETGRPGLHRVGGIDGFSLKSRHLAGSTQKGQLDIVDGEPDFFGHLSHQIMLNVSLSQNRDLFSFEVPEGFYLSGVNQVFADRQQGETRILRGLGPCPPRYETALAGLRR